MNVEHAPSRRVSGACPSEEALEAIAAGQTAATADLTHLDTCPACRERLAEFSENNAFLRELRGCFKCPASGDAAVNAGDDPGGATRVPDDALAGYELLCELHRGGQGVVYKAVQTAAKRVVALKVPLRGKLATRQQRARFEREIELVASLRHPSIVTLYEGVVAPDGRSFFAMEYIEGVPLDRWARTGQTPAPDAAQRPAEPASDARSLPAPRRKSVTASGSEVRDRLRLFARVCEAISYAHQRGVIHRDLKPGNILVDQAGEPHVLDFGLGKLMADAYVTEGLAATRTAGGSTAAHTHTGEFVGTPAYAAPEQVRGQPDDIDTRTDVYALGVVLYELLTGRMPYPTSGPIYHIVQHIVETEPARPSSHSRSIDDELETIVCKALAKEPDSRYPSAGALLADIRHYLAGEPIDAKRNSTRYVLWKATRRYRIHLAVATLFALLLAGAAVKATIDAGRVKRERDAADLARVNEVRQREVADAEAARAQREAAISRTVSAFVQSMLSSVDPATALGRDVTVREILESAGRQLDAGGTSSQPEVEAALRTTLGRSYQSLALHPPAQRQFEAALALQRQLSDGRVERGAALAGSLSDLAMLRNADGDFSQAEQLCREALDLYEQLAQREPAAAQDVAARLGNLGAVLRAKGDYAGAEAIGRKALALNRDLFGNAHPNVATCLNHLANALHAQGNLAEAEPLLREALAIRRSLHGPDHPYVAAVLLNLAALVSAKGDYPEAERLYRETLDLNLRLRGPIHTAVAYAMNGLAEVLRQKGELAEAEQLHRDALAMREKLLPEGHRDIAVSVNNIGITLLTKRDYAGAEQFLRRALTMNRRASGGSGQALATNLNNLAKALQAMGAVDEAEPLFRESLDILRSTFDDEHPLVADAECNLGQVLAARGDAGGAEVLFRHALGVRRQRLPQDHPKIAENLLLLAKLLAEAGQHEEAEPLLRECVQIRANGLPAGQWPTANAKGMLGACLTALGRFDEAEPLLLGGFAAIAADPTAPEARQRDSLERIIRLYEAWGRPEQTAEWRAKLGPMDASHDDGVAGAVP